MKLLEEDPAETTRDILLIISQQIANNSFPHYQSVDYQTPQYAVVVNGLFFASLSCGLVVVLVAVLALQWVANYDIGLNTSPLKRALQRQLQWTGIEKWKMAGIIAFLPLLIFISLFLFFMGLADWLWHMNRTISGIVIGGIGTGFLLYIVTTLISVITIEAPFRTPISKSLRLLMRQAKFFIKFPVEVNKRYQSQTVVSPWNRICAIWRDHRDKKCVRSKSFLKQEDLVVNEKKEVPMECLLWLANSIEISPNSQFQLMALVKELIEVPAELLMQKEKMVDAPWEAVFTTLSSPYINRQVERWIGDEKQNVIDICRGMSMIPITICSSSELYAFLSSIKGLKNPLASTISSFALARNGYPSEFSVGLAHATKPNVISELGENYLYLVLLAIQSKWDDIGRLGSRELLLGSIGQLCTISADNADKVRSIPAVSRSLIPSLEVIINLVVHVKSPGPIVYTNKRVYTLGLRDRYTTVAQQLMEGDTKAIVNRVHRGIQQQLLTHIARVGMLPRSVTNNLKELVEFLLQISSYKPLALAGEERNRFISILTRMHVKNHLCPAFYYLWDGLRVMCEANGCLENQFTAVITALDDYLASEHALMKEDYENLSRTMTCSEWKPYDFGFLRDRSSPWDKLSHVKDPCLVWWLLQWSPNDWLFRPLIQPDFRLLEDRVDILAFPVHWETSESLPNSAVAFIRTLVIDGSPKMQDLAMHILGNHVDLPSSEYLIPTVSSAFSP
jgi:hypothetical protein